jgi:hypothetical protein
VPRRQQLNQERLRDLHQDAQCRVNQFFSASVRVLLRAVQHYVRENGGRCIRRGSLPLARVPWEWDRVCLRDQRVREAVRELRPAGRVNDMFRAG